MLSSVQNKGFCLTFENNLTISVMFGVGNYCERRDYNADYKNEMKIEGDCVIKSKSAEIAIWDKDNNWFNFGSDQVKGYVSASEVAEWIHRVQSAESLESLNVYREI